MVDAELDDIKDVLRGGKASDSTVVALDCLLQTGETPTNATTIAGTNTRGKGTLRPHGNKIQAKTKSRRAESVVVREDEPVVLSARQRYALATEVVNISLKVLDDSAKRVNAAQLKPISSPSATKETPCQGRDLSGRPLQICSGNSTPVQANSSGSKRTAKASTGNNGARIPPQIAYTAECALRAFAYLRSNDPQSTQGRSIPAWQLESGLLSLSGSLSAHGLDSMALKPLHRVKRRFEAYFAPPIQAKAGKVSTQGRTSTERETLAMLLRLDCLPICGTEALTLATSYHAHILKILASYRKPTAIEEAVRYLEGSAPNCAIDLILRRMEESGDKGKAAKQLEQLSKALLSLCPSIDCDVDEMAIDATRSPSPEAAFQLQAMALKSRQLWWSIVQHEPDISQELLRPFGKYAAAFLRRCSKSVNSGVVYESILSGFKSLSLKSYESKSSPASHIRIYDILCTGAEEAGRTREAHEWSRLMTDLCSLLDEDHVLRLVAILRESALHIKHSSSKIDLPPTLKMLAGPLSGNAGEFDVFLKSLADLTRIILDFERNLDPKSVIQIPTLAATFALRFARTRPSQDLQDVRQILDNALQSCKTTDALLSWINPAAAVVFMKIGVLRTIASHAASTPLASAWSYSTDAVSLSRILRALVLQSVRLESDQKSSLLFEDETLQPNERGALLEWQLVFLSELADKPKYLGTLRMILATILPCLSKIYDGKTFPIRRARVAALILRLRGSHRDILPPHLSKTWLDTRLDNGTDLGEDAGLQSLYEDTKATLSIARSFAENRPGVRDLRPSLLIWEQLCNASESFAQIRRKIHDPRILHQQLESIAAYFGMLGEDYACLKTRSMLLKLGELSGESSDVLYHALINLARQHLQLGYAEQAKAALSRAEALSIDRTVSCLAKLDYHITSAECLLSVDNLERCRMSLDKASEQNSQCLDQNMSEKQTQTYRMLHARAWLARSACSWEVGAPHEALSAAKQSVKIVNALWSAIENPGADPSDPLDLDRSDAADSAIEKLDHGVSKLQLQPKSKPAHRKAEGKPKRGAAFWALVPILCKSLLQLSDMYSHHGIFNDAAYYSEKAVQLAESVGSTALLSRIRSHRSGLLILAGRVQDAELCLAQDESTTIYHTSLALVERYCALASVCKQENPRESAMLYEKAETVITCIAEKAVIASAESFTNEIDALEDVFESMSLKENPIQAASWTDGGHGTDVRSSKPSSRNPKQKDGSKRVITKTTLNTTTPSEAISGEQGSYILQKMRTEIIVQKALAQAHQGHNVRWTLSKVEQSSTSTPESLVYSYARYQELIHRATDALQKDVVLNVLRESTLCIPALRVTESLVASNERHTTHASSAARGPKARPKSAVKTSKKETSPQSDYVGPLQSAKQLLLKTQRTKMGALSTADVHKTCAMLLKAGSLLSSISKPSAIAELNSQSESMMVDHPRSHALQSERYAISLESLKNCPELPWPSNDYNCPRAESLSASEFQRDFVDILPKTWAAISLCLNEDASELYVSRYDSGKTPIILRLPFSRHKPDGLEEETFDFHRGKAELQEIIDLSNYSCHYPGNQGAEKSKWWSERQALDRQLGELLINIERIWFGGFKGVFAQYATDADNLSRFRKTFENILGRHLPSRKASKRQTEELSLSDGVLQLFIGLGHDQSESMDLDEPLCDLLYFVVDMLQFNGERNAYDEIDFDSMAVDVLDALRAYHETSSGSDDESRHLILVLDRRLQVFPWESLPCMEHLSVSRVGSMLSLRERILAQRASLPKRGNARGGFPGTIAATGTYILNPSSDLPRSQAMLQPTLSKLDTDWNGIVGQKPDEARFASAITDSSVLLYFGHGPGSQYIRPRKVRQLATCCNVAWLMGCSSGAVVEHGDLEPSAVPFAYLLAGTHAREDDADKSNLCQAVVATLWDVTDKDIDRFSLRLGEEWGLWPPSEDSKLPVKLPRKKHAVAVPSTPQRAPKTPKTPKVVRSPVPFRTPARDRTVLPRPQGRNTSLVEAMSRSREACYLRYLNGAAPVVYGVPVYLEK